MYDLVGFLQNLGDNHMIRKLVLLNTLFLFFVLMPRHRNFFWPFYLRVCIPLVGRLTIFGNFFEDKV